MTGGRICPGRHLADASLWVAIVNILATFRISYTRDENGKNIIPPQEYDSGISRLVSSWMMPMAFKITDNCGQVIRNHLSVKFNLAGLGWGCLSSMRIRMA